MGISEMMPMKRNKTMKMKGLAQLIPPLWGHFKKRVLRIKMVSEEQILAIPSSKR